MKKNHFATYRLTIHESVKTYRETSLRTDYYITIMNLPGNGNINEFRVSIRFKSPGTIPVAEYSKVYHTGKTPLVHELLPYLKGTIEVHGAGKGRKPGKEKVLIAGRNRQADVYASTQGKSNRNKCWYLDRYPLGGLVRAAAYNREGAETASFLFLEKGKVTGDRKKGRRKFRPEFYSHHALRPVLDETQFIKYMKTYKRLCKKRDLPESGLVLDTGKKSVLRRKSLAGKISGKDVILAGEVHDSPGSHMLQLDLVRSLSGQGREIVIGFEMFDRSRSVQKGLDDFVEGKIDEERFIHSVYNRCWTPDWYDLYRDIFIFARDNNIRLLGLNPPQKLMEKFKKDPGSLSKRERALFPREIDYSDTLHRKITQWNFKDMAEMGLNVDTLYPGQCIWEDTMSDSIVNFLAENQGTCMIVCVGALHTAYRVSLPARIKRMAEERGADISTVSLFPHTALEFTDSAYHDLMLMDIADYVYFIPPEMEEDENLPDEDDELSWMEGYKLFSEGKLDEAALSLKGDHSFVAKKIREKIRLFRKSRDAALSGDFKTARKLLEDIPDIYEEAAEIWVKRIEKCEKNGTW
jgi:uncharacterized iron-regulated protein